MEDGIFSTNGRIRRSTYLLRLICIRIPYFIITICLLLFFFFIIGSRETTDETGFIIFIFCLCIYIIISIIQFALVLPQTAKHLHDMNMSGWFALLTLFGLIPYIGTLFNLIFSIILIVVDGTIGENQYGEDPKQRVPYVRYETN